MTKTDDKVETLKKRTIKEEEIVQWTAHNLSINLAQMDVAMAEAELELKKAHLKKETAKFGIFRSHLTSDYRLGPDDVIDEQTGEITKKKEPAPTNT